jgi:hypothetical protein
VEVLGLESGKVEWTRKLLPSAAVSCTTGMRHCWTPRRGIYSG